MDSIDDIEGNFRDVNERIQRAFEASQVPDKVGITLFNDFYTYIMFGLF